MVITFDGLTSDVYFILCFFGYVSIKVMKHKPSRYYARQITAVKTVRQAVIERDNSTKSSKIHAQKISFLTKNCLFLAFHYSLSNEMPDAT